MLLTVLNHLLFLSTLSLRRATQDFVNAYDVFQFLSTLSLRRATAPSPPRREYYNNFYPRSPCGERLRGEHHANSQQEFLSTLSLRRATYDTYAKVLRVNISIHALLAESDNARPDIRQPCAISIHALLAESDFMDGRFGTTRIHFYPRSPCGERPALLPAGRLSWRISIHALLAESDSLAHAAA